MSSKDQKASDTAISCDLNENIEPFLTSGCDDYFKFVKTVLGSDPLQFTANDPGLVDTHWDMTESEWAWKYLPLVSLEPEVCTQHHRQGLESHQCAEL